MPDTTEEQIQAVHVGKPRLQNGPIYLAPYDSSWPLMFSSQARRIRDILGTTAILVEHAGSTSVSGLVAKPIIDIILVVPDTKEEQNYVAPLEADGYVLKVREPDWFEHRSLAASDMDVNLHVFSEGCAEIKRMLVFRDWLRANKDDRKLYAETKCKLAVKTWKYVQQYADAKTEVGEEILKRAMAG